MATRPPPALPLRTLTARRLSCLPGPPLASATGRPPEGCQEVRTRPSASVGVGAAPGLPVARLRGGCQLARARLGLRGRELEFLRLRTAAAAAPAAAVSIEMPACASAAAEASRARAAVRPRTTAGPRPTARRCPAEPARALDLRRRPGTRSAHAAPRRASAPGHRRHLRRCRRARPSAPPAWWLLVIRSM